MTFQKTFDELLDPMLTDYRNQFPDVDTSQGSLIFIKSACIASALWGLYKYQEYISKQIFPDTADTANLEHHAWLYNIARKTSETDASLLARVLDEIRNPASGGTKVDYEKWANSIDNVDQAYCIPMAQGEGTVDVIVLANASATGSAIPSSHAINGTATSLTANKLIDSAANFQAALPVRKGDIVVNDALSTQTTVTANDSANQLSLEDDIFTATGQAYTIKSLTAQVKEYIDTVRPVTVYILRVLPPTVTTQAVTMTVTGTGVDKTTLAAQISAYIDTLEPGEPLYISRLIAIAIEAGAVNAVVGTPSADVDPDAYTVLRAGTVAIN